MMEENESRDGLEHELSALRPRALSPEFSARLAKRLTEAEAPSPVGVNERPRHDVRWALVLSTAALILIAAWFVHRQQVSIPQAVPPVEIVVIPEPSRRAVSVRNEDEPLLIAYIEALRDPQRDLDELLDLHARTLLPNVPDALAVSAPFRP